MTTPMMNETRERAALADLQGSLIELIDLSLTAKQAHWNVVGESFKPVHLQLDEIYDVCRLGADEVAERIATLGGEPDGRARTVADDEAAIEFPAGRVQASEAVALIGRLLDQLAARLGERIVRLAEADPISQGILIATATQIEKQAWMLRAQRS